MIRENRKWKLRHEMNYQKISQHTTFFQRKRLIVHSHDSQEGLSIKCLRRPRKIFRKFPKINLCFPQNDSNKSSRFLLLILLLYTRNTFFRMTRGSLSLLSPSRNAISELSVDFSSCSDCRLHLSRRRKRVSIISEMKLFLHFQFLRKAEGKSGKATAVNFRYPPSKCNGMCCHLCVFCRCCCNSWRERVDGGV